MAESEKTNKTPKTETVFIICNCPQHRHPRGGYRVKIGAKTGEKAGTKAGGKS